MNPIEIANQAYDKDFRWWFLVLLICVLAGGLWALKYLISKSESEHQTHKEQVASLIGELSASRNNHHDRMETQTHRAFEMAKEMTAALVKVERTVEANTRESEKVRGVIEKFDNRR